MVYSNYLNFNTCKVSNMENPNQNAWNDPGAQICKAEILIMQFLFIAEVSNKKQTNKSIPKSQSLHRFF